VKRLGRRLEERAARTVLWTLTLVTVAVLVFIIFFILRRGLPVLNLEFLTTNPGDMGKTGGSSRPSSVRSP